MSRDNAKKYMKTFQAIKEVDTVVVVVIIIIITTVIVYVTLLMQLDINIRHTTSVYKVSR